MLASFVASMETVVVDGYLGFEIRVEEGGLHVAQSTFQERAVVLEAETLPAVRKLVWQWWPHVNVCA